MAQCSVDRGVGLGYLGEPVALGRSEFGRAVRELPFAVGQRPNGLETFSMQRKVLLEWASHHFESGFDAFASQVDVGVGGDAGRG
jgi:hypothetical protein